VPVSRFAVAPPLFNAAVELQDAPPAPALLQTVRAVVADEVFTAARSVCTDALPLRALLSRGAFYYFVDLAVKTLEFACRDVAELQRAVVALLPALAHQLLVYKGREALLRGDLRFEDVLHAIVPAHGTLQGADSLAAALAGLRNPVRDVEATAPGPLPAIPQSCYKPLARDIEAVLAQVHTPQLVVPGAPAADAIPVDLLIDRPPTALADASLAALDSPAALVSKAVLAAEAPAKDAAHVPAAATTARTLPVTDRLLLVAAALASYLPARTDAAIFGTHRSRTRYVTPLSRHTFMIA
jgi:hypothetical protein